MRTYDLKTILEERAPESLEKIPSFLRGPGINFMEWILKVDAVNRQVSGHAGWNAIDFIDHLFSDYNFSVEYEEEDRLRIPETGRLIVVSNHPLGGLDGLALLKLLRLARPDARGIVNDLLMKIPQFREIFLPIDAFGQPRADSMRAIHRALENEEAVMIFPSGEVSRPGKHGVEDGEWSFSPIHFARKFDAPILPIYMEGRNSRLFYALSRINTFLSMLMLPRQMMNRRRKSLRIHVGDLIPASSFQPRVLKKQEEAALLRRHVYSLGDAGDAVYRTVEALAPAEDPKALQSELQNARLLGEVGSTYEIYMLRFEEAPCAMREIGRLRERTFRKVGEGTGKRLDLDSYDPFYRHLVLWNTEQQEIVGAYRLGICKEIMEKEGLKSLYTSSLFDYGETFIRFWPSAIECGRTFVREEYWNTRALDYLWQGIGAFLVEHPEIRFLIGGVSISNWYPLEAKDMIVYFYSKWFKDGYDIATGKSPYTLSEKRQEELRLLFCSEMFKDDQRVLKENLKHLGVSLPVLYRLYVDLCEPDGLHFLAFSVDKNFEHCVDGLILVDTALVKERRKRSYRKPLTTVESKRWEQSQGLSSN